MSPSHLGLVPPLVWALVEARIGRAFLRDPILLPERGIIFLLITQMDGFA